MSPEFGQKAVQINWWIVACYTNDKLSLNRQAHVVGLWLGNLGGTIWLAHSPECCRPIAFNTSAHSENTALGFPALSPVTLPSLDDFISQLSWINIKLWFGSPTQAAVVYLPLFLHITTKPLWGLGVLHVCAMRKP